MVDPASVSRIFMKSHTWKANTAFLVSFFSYVTWTGGSLTLPQSNRPYNANIIKIAEIVLLRVVKTYENVRNVHISQNLWCFHFCGVPEGLCFHRILAIALQSKAINLTHVCWKQMRIRVPRIRIQTSMRPEILVGLHVKWSLRLWDKIDRKFPNKFSQNRTESDFMKISLEILYLLYLCRITYKWKEQFSWMLIWDAYVLTNNCPILRKNKILYYKTGCIY